MRLLLATALLLGGCSLFVDDVETVFPPGLAPLEDCSAPAPTAPGVLFATGEGDVDWAHGNALIDAPLAAVAAALADPEVVRDPTVSGHSIEWDVEPEYETSFVLHYTDTRVITISFDVTWREGLIEGTAAAPVVYAARYQKTSGASVIATMEGSIVARAEGQRTRLEMVSHLKAMTSGPAECQAYLQAIVNQLNAAL